MKLKVFSTIICILIATAAFAQYKIIAKVESANDHRPLPNCTIKLNDLTIGVTDSIGEFIIVNTAPGNYTVSASMAGYVTQEVSLVLGSTDKQLTIRLVEISEMLTEVVVTEQKNTTGFSRLKAVENLGIYEGKKTEVIIPDQLVANQATNNARQIYSHIAGLNIWENDGAGIQLSIGGRGLDPNRTSNFNVRQNGYDISADALGYPESYYTPPVEAISQIQIVRGAAALQYGTQFGGLLNFMMKKPSTDKKFELTARQSLGSYGFYNTFTSAGGTLNRLSYYGFFQYKTGSGWRGNSQFNNYTSFGNLNYQLTDRIRIGLDITHMDYLSKQPGGLSDKMFRESPIQSNRERNWFKVNWNLLALHFDHKINPSNEINLRLFGLSASRYTVGFRENRVETPDLDAKERDLIKGDFANWGAEARYLKRYSAANKSAVLLIGSRYYHGFNHSVQGYGSKEKNANFNYIDPDKLILNDYRFPNRNMAVFAENIFWINNKFSIVPGLRYEHINTEADGFYAGRLPSTDDNSIELGARKYEFRTNTRQFILGGLGLTYRPNQSLNLYGNISQNYRSITFSDMRISNPSSDIDPNMTDEKGYSMDLGIRSEANPFYSYDVSAFYLNYNNRIGEYQTYDSQDKVIRRRTNIGQAVIIGLESFADLDLIKLINEHNEDWTGRVFLNAAFIKSDYKKSSVSAIRGKEVEFVPALNLKSGLQLGFRKLMGSLQYTYLSDQYSDATNAVDGGFSGVVGLIPAYQVLDFSMAYQFNRFRIEGNINNLTDEHYYTRRATGYPGPGIIPSDNRSFYLSIQVRL